jgi:hypothetical protein
MQNVLPALSVFISPLDAMYIEVFPQFRLPDIKIASSDEETRCRRFQNAVQDKKGIQGCAGQGKFKNIFLLVSLGKDSSWRMFIFLFFLVNKNALSNPVIEGSAFSRAAR